MNNRDIQALRRKSDFDLCDVCENGGFSALVDDYITYCRACDDDDEKSRKKRYSRFPNIAGFCRFCGVGRSQIETVRKEYPTDYDAFCTVLEDEALNSDLSVSLISTYMKYRLGYGGDEPDGDRGKSDTCDSMPRIVFEHDILADGE